MIHGIGIDAIEIDRIRHTLGRWGDRFLERVFTQAERDEFARWADPAERVAGRFALKEACMKALGTGWSRGVRWRDIEGVRLPTGRPTVRLHGQARRIFSALGATQIHASITHTRRDAIAVVVFE